MIEIKNLTLAVSDKILLKNFNATIQMAERIGIFGPNGAGKSTFLKSLIDVFPRQSGEILFDGKTSYQKCYKIAYLPQEFDVLPIDYSVMGYLQLLIRGNQYGIPVSTSKDRLCCEAALEKVNALHLQKKSLKKLSGGERKRIQLAALLFEDIEVLLLDEPLANLDPRYQYELLQLIEELQKKLNLTLFITAHDFNPLLHLLDRVMFIGEGQAVLDIPSKVIQGAVLSDLYKTPLQVIDLNGRKWVLSDEQQAFLSPGEHCHGEHCIPPRIGIHDV